MNNNFKFAGEGQSNTYNVNFNTKDVSSIPDWGDHHGDLTFDTLFSFKYK